MSLDGGFTCPNRDGTIGSRGCIFCSRRGSGDFSEPASTDISAQIERAKAQVAKKARNCGYIAYFQSFTNTYAPAERLRKLFTEAISHPDVCALSVATRPDCLPEETLEMLARLNGIKPVWVELGLQTVHEKTAGYIRRGFSNGVFEDAVKNLKARGIYTVAHMIIGLPQETPEMIFETASYIGNSGADGVKFHMLHVLRGADLANDYSRGLFTLPTLAEYTHLLSECIKRIPPDMAVHRLTGDGSKRDLIAPLWSADKKRVLNYIHAEFQRTGLIQGELFKPVQ